MLLSEAGNFQANMSEAGRPSVAGPPRYGSLRTRVERGAHNNRLHAVWMESLWGGV